MLVFSRTRIWSLLLALNSCGNRRKLDGFKVLVFVSGSFATLCKLSYLPLHLPQLIRPTSLIANLAISACLLQYGISQISSSFYISENFDDLWKLGLGAINQMTLMHWGIQSTGSQGLIANALVANLPQVYMTAFWKWKDICLRHPTSWFSPFYTSYSMVFALACF